jgi:branched-chain amino acid transport system substrate-binding protein
MSSHGLRWLWIYCAAAFLAAPCPSAEAPPEAKKEPQPYEDFSKKGGAGFQGPGRDEVAPLPEGGIRIGLAGPEKSREGREFLKGAALAIEAANAAGGFKGKPFVPVVRLDDGPWGMVSKQLVALAFDDEVWAIVGGLDGGRAHVAELVAAKAWVPVVNSAASDFTIDYANVPWVFRVMPSDAAQAKCLISRAATLGYRRMALVIEGDRDSKAAQKNIQEAARKAKLPLDFFIEYDPKNPEAAAARLESQEIDAFILWGDQDGALRFLKAARSGGVSVPALAGAALATPAAAAEADSLGDLTVAAPYDLSRPGEKLSEFQRRYEAATGEKPSPVAALAYDATSVTLEAIRRADLSRARIRDELAATNVTGLTGAIRLSDLGGNPREPVLLRLQDGKWSPAAADAVHR